MQTTMRCPAAAAHYPSEFDKIFKLVAAYLGPQDLLNVAMACPSKCLRPVQDVVFSEDFVSSRVVSLLRQYSHVNGFNAAAALGFVTDAILEVSSLSRSRNMIIHFDVTLVQFLVKTRLYLQWEDFGRTLNDLYFATPLGCSIRPDPGYTEFLESLVDKVSGWCRDT